jgi:hypothetical protein
MRRLNRIAVRFSRTVACLATVNVIFARKDNLRMAGLLILDGFVLVAILACLRARKFGGRRGKFRHTAGPRADSGLFCARLPVAKQMASTIARIETRRKLVVRFIFLVDGMGFIGRPPIFLKGD